MQVADLIILVIYFIGMVAVGIFFSRQMHSVEIYFASGKQLSWWIGGISFAMSYVSALSIIVYAGLGYKYGLVALTLYWTTVPACAITTLLFAKRWRRAGVITPTEFLEQRFSPMIRQLFVWSGVPLKIIDESLKIVATGIFISAATRLSPPSAMVVVGVTILIYSMLGGLWAVVVTDFVQFIIVIAAVLLLLPLTFRAAGGLQHVIAVLPQSYFAPVQAPYGWKYVGSFLILSTLSIAGNWSLIQKFYSARSDRDAVRLGWLATVIFFCLPPIWIITGMLARGYLTAIEDFQSIYAVLSVTLLPPGVLGLLVAALLAATMSVLSSGYNVMSAVLTLDVYRRFLHPKAGQSELVFVGRIVTLVIAIIVLGLALGITHFHWTIFDTMVTAFGVFLPPTVIPMLAGLLSYKLSTDGILASFVIGIATGLVGLLYRALAHYKTAANIQAQTIIISATLTIIVLIIYHVAFPVRGEAAERALSFIRGLRPAPKPEVELILNPSRIAGIVIVLMGLALIFIGVVSLITIHFNMISLIMGCIFTLVGLVIIAVRPSAKRIDNPKRIIQ